MNSEYLPKHSAAPPKIFKRKFLFGYEQWVDRRPVDSKRYFEMLVDKTEKKPTGKVDNAITLFMYSLLCGLPF